MTLPGNQSYTSTPRTTTSTVGLTAQVIASHEAEGYKVVNEQGEHLGKIDQFVLDVTNGRVAYAVLSFGGFLGMGDKLFALPWSSIKLDEVNKEFTLIGVDKETLKNAPGFDKDHWPTFADEQWSSNLHSYYQADPYWKDNLPH
ncbi:sporulation protein YlmC with PRC-barrel domain [Silvimonas terrae]|uniref:Sporulation protein YlmC with PRC-barrel domain n=1 Tax=Silvimonas terrae TaxID=300266 RepID=A0A840RC70_9NEIS|nr:PRC-barrel domain-containing protein [Silvimonas terrae]MBB5190164.1 sporulation protein YlmC with PRC-barrel domain [Silvimonas terrae]